MSKNKHYEDFVTRTIFSFILLFYSLGVYAQDQLEATIKKEFEQIKTVAKEPGAYLVIEDVPNQSSRSQVGGTVIINLRQIKRTLETVKVQNHVYVVRLFIAHEIAHQTLYRLIGRNQPLLLNECQADILSGFFFFQLLSNEYMQNIEKYNTEGLINLMLNVKDPLEAIFTLGDRLSKDHTHPVREHRRSAFRNGFAYGMLWFSYFVIQNPEIPTATKATVRENFNTLSENLNYTYSENAVSWSEKRAREIIHFGLDHCANLVSKIDWRWNKAGDDPHLYYKIFIKNIGNDRTLLNFESQILLVSREEPDNSMYWEIHKKKLHQTVLKPGATQEISDKIEWTADSKVMPRILLLSDENALYDCATETSLSVLPLSPKTALAQAEQSSLSLGTALFLLYNDRHNIKDYVNSIGYTYDDKDDITLVYYHCQFFLPGADAIEIGRALNSDAYSFKITFAGFTSVSDANAKARELLNLLKEEIPDITISEPGDPKAGINRWTIEENGKRTGRISVMKMSSKDYILTLTLDEEKRIAK